MSTVHIKASYRTTTNKPIKYKKCFNHLLKIKCRAQTRLSLILVVSSIFKALSHNLLVQREHKPGCPRGRMASRHKTSSFLSPKQKKHKKKQLTS